MTIEFRRKVGCVYQQYMLYPHIGKISSDELKKLSDRVFKSELSKQADKLSQALEVMDE